MDLYIDVFLFENFVINLFIIVITMKLLKGKRRRKREILAALLGMVYTIVMIFPKLMIFTGLPFKIIVSIIMVAIAMGIRNIIQVIKGTVILNFTSLFLSGICYWLWTNSDGYSLEYGFTINSYPIKFSIIALLVVFLLLERVMNLVKDKLFVENYIYNLVINYKSKEIRARGFLDTGNELREPITDLPVIVIQKNLCELAEFNEKEAIYINFKTVDGAGGKLKGYKVKDIVIENHKSKLIRDAIVCVTENILSGEGTYNALLSRGIV